MSIPSVSAVTDPGQRWGVGSSVDRLRRVLLRAPSRTGDFLGAQWRTPDPDLLASEHEGYATLLTSLGCEVEIAPAVAGLVDSCYAHDPIIMTPFGAIVLRMRKAARVAEPALLADQIQELGIPILGALTGDAFSDGGDKVWLDPQTLLLGRGYRTNDAAISQIRALVEPLGVQTFSYDLPNYRGESEVLHLMSVISPLSHDVAVIYEPLIPIRMLELLADRGIRTIGVDDAEFATQGGNVLAVRPGVVVVPAGNDRVAAAMSAAGCEVHTFDGPNICVKGDGGPTCLTQPLWRTSD